MSGKKRSEWRLSRESEERQRLVDAIDRLRRQIDGVRGELSAILERASPAVVRSAEEAVGRAHVWLERVGESDAAITAEQRLAPSTSARAELEATVGAGSSLVRELDEVLYRRPRRRRESLRGSLAASEARFRCFESTVREWCGEDACRAVADAIEQCRGSVVADDLDAAEQAANSAERRLAEAVDASLEKQKQSEREEGILRLERASSELAGRRDVVKDRLDRAMPGVRDLFSAQSARAVAWLEETRHAVSTAGAADEDSTDELQERAVALERFLESGAEVVELLVDAFERQAETLHSEAEAEVSRLAANLEEHRESLRRWSGADAVRSWEESVVSLRKRLAALELRGLAASSRELGATIGEAAAEADEVEAKHRRRLYFAKALRQVCHDMGFEEKGKSHYLRPGDPRSPIVLEFDTVNQGGVRFQLSLDSIDANSCISQEACPGGFHALTRELQDRFGVETDWRTENGDPLPELEVRAAKSQPGDTSRRIGR